ncbi:MAG: PQQ-binding-like beta-propeller repeat protein [Microcella sp.]|uniref:outer membrane protein assembly factor BamB family protein n=1 Tax=Microcella sp. TaxID=1913979 RepID=UPI0024C82D8C|nr:PQQ-binding-like beta-propeller repeat protein [Microcella sp.]UYN84599.1 MAG: PQQ-binding-like beta-propeller repeat protein [Microcella sp.]
MLPSTPEHPEPTPPAHWPAWVAVPLVAVVVAMALAGADAPPSGSVASAAELLVPLDGHRTLTTSADGVVTVTEHARTAGIEGALDAPSIVVSTLLEHGGEDGVRRSRFWRASRTDDEGGRVTDLYRLGETGVAQVATWGSELGLVFDPALVLVPADAVPGSSWQGTGSALPGGLLTYTASTQLVAVTEPILDYGGREIALEWGCIGVRLLVTITDPVDQAENQLDESTVWCPGRGPVWSTGTVNGASIGFAEVPTGAVEARGDSPRAAASWPRDARSLTAPVASTLTLTDGFFGDFLATGQYTLPVVAADADAVLIDDRGNSVQRWSLQSPEPASLWSSHPGGTILSAAAVGPLTVVTTEARQTAAYDLLGRRVWSTTMDELALAPVAQHAGDPIVLTLAGTVSRLDASSGVPRWSADLGGDGRGAPVAAAGVVLAADERGRVTAVDAETGELRWRIDPGPVEAMTVSELHGSAVLVLESGLALAVALSDGSTTWSVQSGGDVVHQVLAGDAAFVLVGQGATRAVHPTTGSVLWVDEGAAAAAIAGGSLVSLRASELVLQSVESGDTLASRTLGAVLPGVTRSLSIIGDSVIVVDSTGTMWRAAAR